MLNRNVNGRGPGDQTLCPCWKARRGRLVMKLRKSESVREKEENWPSTYNKRCRNRWQDVLHKPRKIWTTTRWCFPVRHPSPSNAIYGRQSTKFLSVLLLGWVPCRHVLWTVNIYGDEIRHLTLLVLIIAQKICWCSSQLLLITSELSGKKFGLTLELSRFSSSVASTSRKRSRRRRKKVVDGNPHSPVKIISKTWRRQYW